VDIQHSIAYRASHHSILVVLIAGQEKAVARSKYEEDIYPGNHSVRFTFSEMSLLDLVLNLMQTGLLALQITVKMLC
jgi:hypothetical protein